MLNLYEGLLLEEYIEGLYKTDMIIRQEEMEKAKKHKMPRIGG